MNATRIRRTRSKIVLAILASVGLLSGGLVGGIALAGHTPDHVSFSGKGVVAMKTVTDVEGGAYSGDMWQSVPGSSNYVSVPSGVQRVASVTFAATSFCRGTGGHGCLVRVVARKSGTTDLVEFYPRSTGLVYFDTATNAEDAGESHAIVRTKTLTAGTWQIFAQARTTAASGVGLFIYGYSHKVDLYAK